MTALIGENIAALLLLRECSQFGLHWHCVGGVPLPLDDGGPDSLLSLSDIIPAEQGKSTSVPPKGRINPGFSGVFMIEIKTLVLHSASFDIMLAGAWGCFLID